MHNPPYTILFENWVPKENSQALLLAGSWDSQKESSNFVVGLLPVQISGMQKQERSTRRK